MMDMTFENIVAPHNINFGVGGDGEPLMEGNKYVPLVSGLRFANITGIAHPRCDFSAACKHSNGARKRRAVPAWRGGGCASVALTSLVRCPCREPLLWQDGIRRRELQRLHSPRPAAAAAELQLQEDREDSLRRDHSAVGCVHQLGGAG